MKSKILSKNIELPVSLLVLAFFAVLIFYFIPERPVQSDPVTNIENAIVTPKQEQASSGLPVRLKIPSVNVDATIDQMGITPSGAMEVPSGARNVGWFKLGPRPGDKGSAVIDGHYGRWANGDGSVFDDLNKLKKGDKVYVEDEKGITYTFLVREFRDYDPKADASSVFVSNDGKSHLNIITCEGVWNKVSKSYSERLVVFTDKE
ncbi:MAG: class F sortase [bacterium]|nr:class F sortase [bacterium]